MSDQKFYNEQLEKVRESYDLEAYEKRMAKLGHDIKALKDVLHCLPIDYVSVEVFGDCFISWADKQLWFVDRQNEDIDSQPLGQCSLLTRFECEPYLHLVLKEAFRQTAELLKEKE